MKSDTGIATFLSIKITKNYILKNLDVRYQTSNKGIGSNFILSQELLAICNWMI